MTTRLKRVFILLFCLIAIVSIKSIHAFALEVKEEKLPAFCNINEMAYGNELYIQACDKGFVKYSSDALNWESKAISDSNLLGMIYFKNLFYTVDAGGNIFSSANGTDWKITKSVKDAKINNMIKTDAGILAVGDKGFILKSVDGVKWNTYKAPAVIDIHSAAYNSQKGYTFIGYCNGSGYPYLMLYYSKDLKSWKLVHHGSYYEDSYKPYDTAILYGNNMFIAYYSDAYSGKYPDVDRYQIYTSKDGKKWTRLNLKLAGYDGGLVFNIHSVKDGYYIAMAKARMGTNDYPESQSVLLYTDNNFSIKTSMAIQPNFGDKTTYLNNRFFIYGQYGYFGSFDRQKQRLDTIFSGAEYFSYQDRLDVKNGRYLITTEDSIYAVYFNGQYKKLVQLGESEESASTIRVEDHFVTILQRKQKDQPVDGSNTLIKVDDGFAVLCTSDLVDSGWKYAYDPMNKCIFKVKQNRTQEKDLKNINVTGLFPRKTSARCF